MVWPESMFTAGVRELIFEGEIEPPPGAAIDARQFRDAAVDYMSEFRRRTELTAGNLNKLRGGDEPGSVNIRLLVGTETECFGPSGSRHYNSALLIDPGGKIVGRYYKMHPVMFGEYIPLGTVFPWLYQVTPMRSGLTPGESPQVFDIGGLRMSPSICFESTVPHLIRRQVVELTRRGASPDVLVNITNDGWFWGAAILDLHFHWRAVPRRREPPPFSNCRQHRLLGLDRRRWASPTGGAQTGHWHSPRRCPARRTARALPNVRRSPRRDLPHRVSGAGRFRPDYEVLS